MASENAAEKVYREKQRQFMADVDITKRTAEFGRGKPDTHTGRKSSQRKRILTDKHESALRTALARGRRDLLAAEQVVSESRDVVIPEEQAPLGVAEELERRMDAGEFAKRGIRHPLDEVDAVDWYLDYLADRDGGYDFEDQETSGEFDEYLADFEAVMGEDRRFKEFDNQMRRRSEIAMSPKGRRGRAVRDVSGG